MNKALVKSNIKKADKTADEALLAEMRERFALSEGAFADTRESELDDLRFMAGSPDNYWQWPDYAMSNRALGEGQSINARPCLTINKLPQHVRTVTNEQRINRPSGKVIPADSNADVQVAEIYDGLVRHIQYISKADVAYDTACENQVTFGEGYIRLLTEYCSEDTFDQDIKIQQIKNSFSVYMDPLAKDPTGSDSRFCFITEDMYRSQFEREFPGVEPISSVTDAGVGDPSISAWINEDTIRIVEYFYITHTPDVLNLYPNNQMYLASSLEAKEFERIGVEPIKTRPTSVRKVMWVKSNGYTILDRREWMGPRIPVIRVLGNIFEIDGEIYISGLIRNAKDAQRMYNYWTSQEAEMLALAPKAPFIGYGGQFEGYEEQWKTANVNNWPYLEVNPDVQDGQGAVLPLPQRAAPPLAQTGIIQAKMGAADDIKATTGQYGTSLGEMGNERTGAAIYAREQQSNVGTYHFVDNLSHAVRELTLQIVETIPYIYDTQRIARIIGVDGEVSNVRIDPMQSQAVKEIKDESGILIEKIYNPGVGIYDVVVTTGPSYLTKRQESQEAMATLLQTAPQLWPVVGDLLVKNMDWPGAQEISERLRRTVDPKLLQKDDKDPALQMAEQHIQALQQDNEQLMNILENVNKSFEAQDLQREDFEAVIKAYDAETTRMKALSDNMTPQQIQDIVLGTVHGMMQSGDLRLEQRELDVIPQQRQVALDNAAEIAMEPQPQMQQPMVGP